MGISDGTSSPSGALWWLVGTLQVPHKYTFLGRHSIVTDSEHEGRSPAFLRWPSAPLGGPSGWEALAESCEPLRGLSWPRSDLPQPLLFSDSCLNWLRSNPEPPPVLSLVSGHGPTFQIKPQGSEPGYGGKTRRLLQLILGKAPTKAGQWGNRREGQRPAPISEPEGVGAPMSVLLSLG